jgi:hypothetical protein
MSRKAMNTRLKMLYRISPSNAATIYEHILSEQTERNIKTSTSENKVKALLWLTRFLKLKPFEQMTKQDILSYLNGLRKPKEEDPQQKWIVPYNNRLRVYIKFFKWLYNKDESDYRKRKAHLVFRVYVSCLVKTNHITSQQTFEIIESFPCF